MTLQLKKGKADDIHIQLGRKFRSGTNVVPICDTIASNSLNYSFTEELGQEYMIKFYLNPERKRDKSKAKDLSNKMIDENSQPISDILAKYSFQPSASNSKSNDMKPPTFLPRSYKLKLTILYVNSANYNETLKPFKQGTWKKENDAKFLILLEDVKEHIEGKELKNKGKANQQLLMETFLNSQIWEDRKREEDEELFKNKEEFDEFLMELNLNSDLDYKMTDSKEESIKFLENCIVSVIDSKYKGALGFFDTKSGSHTELSIFAGFEDIYSHMFIEMLMTIPGISEEKAIAVLKKYPTVKSLMEDILANPEKLDKLADIQVVHNFDPSKARNLGKITSSKIIRALTSRDPNEMI